ncbi:MAG: endopeptidase La [Bilifractor sp.]|jgi:ATP-dependent Lon protease
MKSYLVIPSYDTVILPDVDYQLGVEELNEEEKSRIKIDDNKVLIVPMKEAKNKMDLTMSDVYGLGVLADVLDINSTKIGLRVHARTREKVEITSLSGNGDILEATFEPKDEVLDITLKGEKDLLDTLKKDITELTTHFQGGQMAAGYVERCKTINELGAMFCQFLDMSPDEKYALLETDSMKQRGLLIEEALKRFKGTVDMQEALNDRYNATEGNFYKKAAIEKQIGLLQKELDDMDPDAAEEENDYRKKIEESGMPAEARKEVDRVLKRYMEMQPNDPDRASSENYLDFVTSLKWKPDELPKVDLKEARRILDKDHYGLDKVKERILQQLAVMALKNRQEGSILLLVGAPGTGKTSMGKSIAEALGRKYVRISLGGVRDEAEIRGHRRTYVGAMPGRIMEGIKRSGAMNPVVVLDEVDKLTEGGFSGDPSSALLEVLDPEQNNTFVDHYMNIPYDLSNVFFICTANSWDTIPQPLLDRMEVIQLSGYTPYEKEQIAKKHLLPRAMEDTGLTRKDISVTDGAIRRIVSEYTSEAGVRGLKKQLDKLCRVVAAKLVEQRMEEEKAGDSAETEKKSESSDEAEKNSGAASEAEADSAAAAEALRTPENGAAADSSGVVQEKAEKAEKKEKSKKITVKEKDVPEYLGNKGILHDRVQKHNPAGIVTGLAWTQAGGEILFIESTAMRGSGQIKLTGQLGDVMKESASIAASLLKSYYINSDLNFRERDIHIHVPEGAVPKDGPSAGITMFTALTSLVNNKPVPSDLAMTGEISLRGQVLPIGGLPEKLMAAQRAGVKKVLIPKDNERDLEDVPKEVRDHLTIVPVENVRQAIREAIGIELPKPAQNLFERMKGDEADEAADKK